MNRMFRGGYEQIKIESPKAGASRGRPNIVQMTQVEHDPSGKAAKLYPFVRLTGTEQPRTVVINPYVSFGKPVIAGTGLPTRVVAERHKAGDSVTELARDYGRKEEEIEDAIRYELRVA